MFILYWTPVFVGVCLAALALIPAMQAKEDGGSPTRAWFQYLVFAILPLGLLFLPLVTGIFQNPLLMFGIIIGCSILWHRIRKRPEDGWHTKVDHFFKPLGKISVLSLLYMSCGMVLAAMLLVASVFRTYQPHSDVRGALMCASLLIPLLGIGVIYHRKSWSWLRRGILSSVFSGSICMLLLLPAWQGLIQVDNGLYRPTLHNDGSFEYTTALEPLLPSQGPFAETSRLDQSGVHLQDKSAHLYPSPDGSRHIEIFENPEWDPYAETRVPAIVMGVKNSEGTLLGILGGLNGTDYIHYAPPQWSSQGDLAYNHGLNSLRVWTADDGVKDIGKGSHDFCWSPDGKALFYRQKFELKKYDLSTGNSSSVFSAGCQDKKHPECRPLLALEHLSPDGRWMPYTLHHSRPKTEEFDAKSYGGESALLDLESGRSLQVEGKSHPLWSPGGRLLAVDEDRTRWYNPTEETYEKAELPVEAKTFEKFGERYLLFDYTTCHFTSDFKTWGQFPAPTTRVGFSEDGRLAYSLDSDTGNPENPQYFRVFELSSGSELAKYDLRRDFTPGFWESHPYRLSWRDLWAED